MKNKKGSLSWSTKLCYGSGDFYGGASATIIGMLFLFFLTDVVGLRPMIAGAIVFLGRFIDAVTDPLMGRISDRTRSRFGRRSPYFLFAALPVGLSFGMLWLVVDYNSWLMILYYSVSYILFSLSFTAVMVPYAALAPELTENYQERTVLISTRMAFSITGALIAAVIPKTIIDRASIISRGYLQMGILFGIIFTLIWLIMFLKMKGKETDRAVYDDNENFLPALLSTLKNKAFLSLIGIYLFAFIVNDILSANFIYYLSYYLKRPEIYTTIMGGLLIVAVLSLVVYVRLVKAIGKRKTFMYGTIYWIIVLSGLMFFPADIPNPVIIGYALFLGIGTGVSYAIPWSMLPEVIDLDQIVSGQRREGLYSGVMTFLRKLSSSLAILGISFILELSGYIPSSEDVVMQQPVSAVLAIRSIISIIPVFCLLLALYSAWKFPIRFDNFRYIQMFLKTGSNGEEPLSKEEKKDMESELSKMTGKRISLEGSNT